MNMKLATFILVFFFVTACRGNDSQQPRKPGFEKPQVPTAIIDPAQRTDYLVRHYWDGFDFTDTVSLNNPESTEQAFSDFLDLLNRVPAGVADSVIRQMLVRAEADTAVYGHMTKLYEKYLYDPNSPFRNEERYIPILQSMVASDRLDDFQKVRPRYRLALALKNRPGMVANDFVYTQASGKTGRLHQLSTPYVLLFFNNPGCDACREIRLLIESSTLIDGLIKDKTLILLSVYPDEDLTAWRDYAAEIPVSWLNAYDRELVISEQNLYDLKAIPTLYLLDKDKKVILKDATFSAIRDFFHSL